MGGENESSASPSSLAALGWKNGESNGEKGRLENWKRKTGDGREGSEGSEGTWKCGVTKEGKTERPIGMQERCSPNATHPKE